VRPSSESGPSPAEMYCPLCERSFAETVSHCPDDRSPLVRLSENVDGLCGEVLDGRFRLEERLGAGGMGTVYRARQLSVDRDVAVKIIRAEYGGASIAVKRFLREARLTSKLNHPNTVTVYEFGRTDSGRLFLAMELLRGRTLSDEIAACGQFSPSRAAFITAQVLDAVGAAHQNDVLHRDIKPQNVIILDEPKGRDYIKVLDFGLAKSLAGDHSTTDGGNLLGTPGYLAPELLLGGNPERASDLYAIGVVLYHLLAGHLPFVAETPGALLMKQAYKRPQGLPAEIPKQLQAVVFRLLEKDPQKRFASAAEARTALLEAVPGAAPGGDAVGTRAASGAGLAGDQTLLVSSLSGFPTTFSLRGGPGRWLVRIAVAGAVLAVVGGAALFKLRTAPLEPQAAAVSVSPPPYASGPSLAPAQVGDGPAPVAAAAAHKAAGTVIIALEPSPAAAAFVDGQPVGQTPVSVEMDASPDAVEVVFRRKGYKTLRTNVALAESSALKPTLEKARSRKSSRQREGARRRRQDGPGSATDLPF
jgi:eukaryotic-like serine/threonine-protein kinase